MLSPGDTTLVVVVIFMVRSRHTVTQSFATKASTPPFCDVSGPLFVVKRVIEPTGAASDSPARNTPPLSSAAIACTRSSPGQEFPTFGGGGGAGRGAVARAADEARRDERRAVGLDDGDKAVDTAVCRGIRTGLVGKRRLIGTRLAGDERLARRYAMRRDRDGVRAVVAVAADESRVVEIPAVGADACDEGVEKSVLNLVESGEAVEAVAVGESRLAGIRLAGDVSLTGGIRGDAVDPIGAAAADVSSVLQTRAVGRDFRDEAVDAAVMRLIERARRGGEAHLRRGCLAGDVGGARGQAARLERDRVAAVVAGAADEAGVIERVAGRRKPGDKCVEAAVLREIGSDGHRERIGRRGLRRAGLAGDVCAAATVHGDTFAAVGA